VKKLNRIDSSTRYCGYFFLLAILFISCGVATAALTLVSAGINYQCQDIHLTETRKYYRCHAGNGRDTLYLTDQSEFGNGHNFSAFQLQGTVPREVPVHAIREGEHVLRETPRHIILNQRQTASERKQFSDLLSVNFGTTPLPDELTPFIAYRDSENLALTELRNCPQIQIKTAGSPARELNCQRGGPARSVLPCKLYQCLHSNGESILLSYDQLLNSNEVPQLWSLRNGNPSAFMHIQQASCNGTLLLDRKPEEIRPNSLPFYYESSSLLMRNTPYDPLSILQRFESNADLLEDQAEHCSAPEVTAHVQAELDFRRRHSTEITRDRLATTIESVNGVLERTVHKVSSVSRDNFCRLQPGVYVERHLAGDQRQLDQLLSEFLLDRPVQFLHPQQLNSVFSEVADLPHMAYGYPLDGCYARAHLIHDYIRRNYNLDCKKIWLRGHYLRPRSAPSIRWVYHVAVTCPTQGPDGSIQYMVIDPTTNATSVTREAWFDSMEVTAPLATGQEFIDDQSIFTFSTSSGDRYQPYSPGSSYEGHLEQARETLEHYENISF
jgi:hypothetical protein